MLYEVITAIKPKIWFKLAFFTSLTAFFLVSCNLKYSFSPKVQGTVLLKALYTLSQILISLVHSCSMFISSTFSFVIDLAFNNIRITSYNVCYTKLLRP